METNKAIYLKIQKAVNALSLSSSFRETLIDGLYKAFTNEGTKGDKGDKGDDGDSAYQVAVNEGYVGTVTEWLASLVGATGPAGKDGTNGTNGKDGNDGTSAGFGTPTAEITMIDSTATAEVSVTATGDNTAKVFSFSFKIPKAASGTGLDNIKIVETNSYLFAITDASDNILWGITNSGVVYYPNDTYEQNITNLQQRVKSLEALVTQLQESITTA